MPLRDDFPSREEMAKATRDTFASYYIEEYKKFCEGGRSVPVAIQFSTIRRTLTNLISPQDTTEGHCAIPHIDLPLKEYLSDLVIRRRLLIYPQGGLGRAGLQDEYHLTPYGLNCWQYNVDPLPIDRDLVIEETRKRFPEVDGITISYLEEGCTAIAYDLYLSAAVCLGAASENEILNLIDFYLERNDALASKFGKCRNLSEKVRLLIEELKNKKCPKQDVEYIDRLEGLTRENRNSAGHPKIVEKREARSRLLYQEFVLYIGALKKVREWISSQSESKKTS